MSCKQWHAACCHLDNQCLLECSERAALGHHQEQVRALAIAVRLRINWPRQLCYYYTCIYYIAHTCQRTTDKLQDGAPPGMIWRQKVAACDHGATVTDGVRSCMLGVVETLQYVRVFVSLDAGFRWYMHAKHAQYCVRPKLLYSC